MSESEDIDLLAAEYALGTLPAAERASVALRARMEPALAAAIEGVGAPAVTSQRDDCRARGCP